MRREKQNQSKWVEKTFGQKRSDCRVWKKSWKSIFKEELSEKKDGQPANLAKNENKYGEKGEYWHICHFSCKNLLKTLQLHNFTLSHRLANIQLNIRSLDSTSLVFTLFCKLEDFSNVKKVVFILCHLNRFSDVKQLFLNYAN